jgi:hypothetical protein
MITSGGWIEFDQPKSLLECDLFLHALGFEHRSVELLRRGNLVRATDTISFAFETPGILSYDDNAVICEKLRTKKVPAKHSARIAIQEYLRTSRKRRVSVAIDISSLNRRLIAELFLELCLQRDRIEKLQIVYTPQQFVEPEAGFSNIGPMQAVAPELTAFDSDPDKPIALMLGLGFEYGLGLGLIDLVEPERTICFKATGFDSRYEDAVKRANFDFEFSTANLLIQSYTLIDPLAAYSGLNNITYGLLASHRIEIVPLGPKLFAAFAVLLSLSFFGQVTVLRIPTNMSNPRDAFARDGFVFAEIELGALGDVASVYESSELSR